MSARVKTDGLRPLRYKTALNIFQLTNEFSADFKNSLAAAFPKKDNAFNGR